MSIQKDIKKLFIEENILIKEAAKLYEEKTGKKMTPDSLAKKIRYNTMKYNEAQELAEALGYKIIFKKQTEIQ